MAKSQKLEDALDKVFAKKAGTPSLEALALKMITAFGGPEEIAKEYVKLYKGAKSPTVKIRMMENFIQMVKVLSADAAPTDWGQFSDDELREMATHALTQQTGSDDAEAAAAGAEAGPA